MRYRSWQTGMAHILPPLVSPFLYHFFVYPLLASLLYTWVLGFSSGYSFPVFMTIFATVLLRRRVIDHRLSPQLNSWVVPFSAPLLRPRFDLSSGKLDVVVIGAGVAGLATARRLVEAGLRVRVLEGVFTVLYLNS